MFSKLKISSLEKNERYVEVKLQLYVFLFERAKIVYKSDLIPVTHDALYSTKKGN